MAMDILYTGRQQGEEKGEGLMLRMLLLFIANRMTGLLRVMLTASGFFAL